MADLYTLTLPDGTLCNMRDSRVDTIPGTTENIVDLIYPVGSIFINTTSVDPNVLFEDTVWEQINGRFLVAQGSNGASGYEALSLANGATGGEKEHLLQAGESGMMAHTHGHSLSVAGSGTLTTNGGGSHGHKLRINDVGHAGQGRNIPVSTASLSNSVFTDVVANHQHTINSHGHSLNGSITKNTEADAKGPHENLPPYLAVYMWKRIA